MSTKPFAGRKSKLPFPHGDDDGSEALREHEAQVPAPTAEAAEKDATAAESPAALRARGAGR